MGHLIAGTEVLAPGVGLSRDVSHNPTHPLNINIASNTRSTERVY